MTTVGQPGEAMLRHTHHGAVRRLTIVAAAPSDVHGPA